MRLAAIVTCLLSTAILGQAVADDLGPPIRSFADLEAYAGRLARTAAPPPGTSLDPFFTDLKYDGHRQIRYRAEEALYADRENTYRIEFFHPGWMFTKPITVAEIGGAGPRPIAFRRDAFDYGSLRLPRTIEYPQGYSGFRVLAPDAMLGRRFEFLVFQGASYFRAVTTELGWGLSARGIAVNTVGGSPEEFPDFTHFWFLEPAPGDTTFRALALLDGPSLTGAYELEARPGETTRMRVRATVFLRRPVTLLGLAPFSSMFWFGENTHPQPYDFRPEVHDSDGLLIEQRHGPLLWRPIDTSTTVRHSVFTIDALGGYGLIERDRDFRNFQDLEAIYHRRVSAWVEPLEGFARGRLHLIELPTGEETWDNIVTFWEPAQIPSVAEPLRFSYMLTWLEEPAHPLARVIATRHGQGIATPENPDDHLFVIDFAPPRDAVARPPGWMPQITVHVHGTARLRDQRVMLNPETEGWRAFFTLDIPAPTTVLELTCDLTDGKRPVAERWTYLWRR